jgi:hypothetical protein
LVELIVKFGEVGLHENIDIEKRRRKKVVGITDVEKLKK